MQTRSHALMYIGQRSWYTNVLNLIFHDAVCIGVPIWRSSNGIQIKYSAIVFGKSS